MKKPSNFRRVFNEWMLAVQGFDDRDEHHGADKCDDETLNIETAYAAIAEEADQPATKDRANNTDDDIEEDALLSIGVHEERCDPANDATEDDIDEKTHMIYINE